MRKSSLSGMNLTSTRSWPSLNGPTTTAMPCTRWGQWRGGVWQNSPRKRRASKFINSSLSERKKSMHSSPSQDLITHGEYLFHTGHMHEALQVFESIMEQEPHNMLALNNKGVI